VTATAAPGLSTGSGTAYVEPDAGCVDEIRNERLARIPPEFSRVRVDPPFLERVRGS
jgi:hypothetical protein